MSIHVKHEREIELHRERLRQVKKRLDTDNSHAITKMQNPRLKKGQQGFNSKYTFLFSFHLKLRIHLT